MNRSRRLLALGLPVAAAVSNLVLTIPMPASNAFSFTGSARDFDFFVGRWHIHNRRLVQRADGASAWEEFEATSDARTLPDGRGHMDSFDAATAGLHGMVLRVFDREAQRWNVYCSDNSGNERHPPMVGGFDGDVGVFEGSDMREGVALRVRTIWRRLSDDEATCEESVSEDAGATWHTRWTMHLVRESALAAAA